MDDDKVVVKPTWGLAWGLFWRQLLIGLAFYGVIIGIVVAIIFALGVSLIPWDMWENLSSIVYYFN